MATLKQVRWLVEGIHLLRAPRLTNTCLTMSNASLPHWDCVALVALGSALRSHDERKSHYANDDGVDHPFDGRKRGAFIFVFLR